MILWPACVRGAEGGPEKNVARGSEAGMRDTTKIKRGHSRSESGHTWNLRNQCRICGMTREYFENSGRPECRGFPKSVSGTPIDKRSTR
jgi:hypothetical protein